MLSMLYAIACPFVCLSISLSLVWISQEWLKLGYDYTRKIFHPMVAHPSSFHVEVSGFASWGIKQGIVGKQATF